MKKNIGSLDRTVRILIALVVAVLFFSQMISGTLAIILLVVGAIFLITGFIGICPIYLALGMRTNKEETETKPTL